MNYTGTVHVVAAGHGSRLKPLMDEIGYEPSHPKHLLPTGAGDGETLLGRIGRQVLCAGKLPVIYVNKQAASIVSAHPDIPDERTVLYAGRDGSFFGPIIRAALSSGPEVTLGASGDHYVDKNPWPDLLDAHDSGRFPVTFAAACMSPRNNGLAYKLRDDGKVLGFKRKARTDGEDMVNVGLYVLTPTAKVLESLGKIGIGSNGRAPTLHQSAEEIAAQLIADGLVGIHELPRNTAFNINDPETYQALLAHNTTKGLARTTQ